MSDWWRWSVLGPMCHKKKKKKNQGTLKRIEKFPGRCLQIGLHKVNKSNHLFKGAHTFLFQPHLSVISLIFNYDESKDCKYIWSWYSAIATQHAISNKESMFLCCSLVGLSEARVLAGCDDWSLLQVTFIKFVRT